jgi:hypothetical protein
MQLGGLVIGKGEVYVRTQESAAGQVYGIAAIG